LGKLNLSLDLKHDLWTYLVMYSVKWLWKLSLSPDVPWCETWYLNLFGSKFGKYIWTYLVLNSVNIKYWDDPCRKNEILAYMVANLINGNVEFVPWFKAWFVNLFAYVFGKMKVLEWPLCKNEIVAYIVTCLINMKVELVPRCPLMRNMIFVLIWF